jgi:type I restriction enzyme, S subunit
MNKQKEPKLRFPGFTGEWQEKRLGDVADVDTGSCNTQDRVEDGLYPFFVRSNTVESINTYAYEGEAILTSGDGVGVGKNFHYIQGKFNYHQRVYCIKEFKEGFLGKYIFLYFSNAFNKRIMKMSAKNSVDSVRRDMIIEMPIFCPSIKEQKKIAEFLSDIDTKIEKLTRKKELTEQYKKSAMQKIFSKKIRFKDENGKNYPDWEEKRLGDVADIYDGTHLTPDYTSSGIPFYSVENVMSNNFTDTKYISEEVYIRECKRIKIEKGDILMTKIGDIGTSRYVDWEVEASFYVSLALIKQSKRYDSKYLSQYIMTAKFQENLHKKTIHVAFPKKINLGEIGNCYAELPCLEEQKKIADFLTNLDKTIEQIQKELAMLKEYKKGLLQGMFV